jgi:hypothetical protein
VYIREKDLRPLIQVSFLLLLYKISSSHQLREDIKVQSGERMDGESTHTYTHTHRVREGYKDIFFLFRFFFFQAEGIVYIACLFC